MLSLKKNCEPQQRAKKRQRQWAPKSRTGCAICRRRRVKCDEEKPNCKRCKRGSFACSYAVLFRQGDLPVQPQLSSTPSNAEPTATAMELNHYFRTQVATHGGCEFTSELWNLHVLRASKSEVAVWHACNYFAAVSRLGLPGHNAAMEMLFSESLRQYSAALKSIMKITKQTSLSTSDKCAILAVNALLVVSSFRNRKPDDAISIISKSIELLKEWGIWDKGAQSPCPVPVMLLALFFVKIERVFENCFLLSPRPSRGWEELLSTLQSLPISSSIGACLELEMLWNDVSTVIGNLSLQPSAQEIHRANALRAALGHRFEIWTSRYQAYRQSQLTKLDSMRNAILKVRQMLVDVLLRVNIANVEMGWDEFEDEFARATILIELLAEQHTDDSTLPPLKAIFLKSLHFMAKRCRNPILRRKMIHLLRQQIQGTSRKYANDTTEVSRTQIIDAIVDLEETAWYGAEESQTCPQGEMRCVAGQMICIYHRVVEVHANINPSLTFDILLRTGADVLNRQPGHTRRVTALVWS